MLYLALFVTLISIFIFKFFYFYQWISLLSLCLFMYILNFYKNLYWKKFNIPYVLPLPIIGNNFELITGKLTQQELQIKIYNYFNGHRFGGVFNMSSPILFVKDTNLIENILIKDFSHFTDRGIPFNENIDPLSAHLFNLKGQRWKNLRNKLSPVFTSGKLKTMHHQLIDCADVLIEVFNKNVKTNEKIDFKETSCKFTTDVIGSCAYGLNINSLNDPNNQFRKMGRKLFETNKIRKFYSTIRLILRSINPKLNYIFGFKSIPGDIEQFFIDMVHNTIRLREDEPEFSRRNDFIQLLMNLRQQDDETKHITFGQNKQEEKVYLDDNTMAANSFLFFVAGFETTASTLTYCLFELAQHPDIQDKLYNEIKEVLAKHDQQPTYDAIKQLTYMDMVISETLRKYPPVIINFRICTESYRIPDTDIIIPKGQRIEIPTYALHHDPKIFPDPEKFQPERFSPENKDSIPKGAYIPFGDGPRICLGARFAQMEIKVCLSKILSKFKIIKNPEMPNEIKFAATPSIILVPKGGIFMNIEPRN